MTDPSSIVPAKLPMNVSFAPMALTGIGGATIADQVADALSKILAWVMAVQCKCAPPEQILDAVHTLVVAVVVGLAFSSTTNSSNPKPRSISMPDSTTPAATPASYVVPVFLAALFGTLLKDEAAVLQPVADTYLTSVINDPSPDNVVAQSMAFPVQAAIVLPKAEQVGLFDTATALKQFIDAQVPSLVAQATAAVSAAAAGTTSATA